MSHRCAIYKCAKCSFEEVYALLAQPESKRQIVETLLPIEEQLKAQNYAAYMKCEIYRYTKSKEEWQARQEKRSKTRVRPTNGSELVLKPHVLRNEYLFSADCCQLAM